MKLALGQIKLIPGQPGQNLESIAKAIAYCEALQVDLVIFPELCLTGSHLGHLWQQPSFVKDCLTLNQEIARLSHKVSIAFGNIGLIHRDRHYDIHSTYYVAQNGQLIPTNQGALGHIKESLPLGSIPYDESYAPYAITNEKENTFTISSHNGEPFTFLPTFGLHTIPTGSLYEGITLQAIIALDEGPFQLDRAPHTIPNALPCPLIHMKPLGLENTGKNILLYEGGSSVYDQQGVKVEHLPEFEDTVKPFLFPLEKKDSSSEPSKTASEEASYGDSPRIFQALQFALKNLLQQWGIKQVVIGASGGIDSALNAALYGTVLRPEHIYLVNMPSRFNSNTTKDLARELAENLGCHYAILPVEESLHYTIQQIEETPFTLLSTGTASHLSLSTLGTENIQARDRSSRILGALSSAVGGVFTCNGNKTEFAIGYATMYGDLAGFLCATGDLWKHQVYALSRYINEVIYGREVIPQGSIDIIPSAELSSAQDVTQGLGDPLQYDYHDRLFRAFIEHHWTPEDVLAHVEEGTLGEALQLPQSVEHYFSTTKGLVEDLERWWHLIAGFAVAKRIQSPPIISLTNHTFGSGFPESQLGPYYTSEYHRLKERLLDIES